MSESKESVRASQMGVGEESMVVRLSRLDKMLELAGEVIIVSANLNALSHQLHEGMSVSRMLSEDAKDLAITSSRISSDLHNLVTDVRTVDMSDLFARFRRLARDTSRRLGKPIRFKLEGEEICIDKKISERIYDPVAHQIRNAIDHGIEDREARQAAGKDPVGEVTVRVRNVDNFTIIDVADDGRGLQLDAIRRKAVEMGLVEESAAEGLAEDALFEFLFQAGFSTARETTGTSGRGVGLDVVRDAMAAIGGETRVQSVPGQGSTFSLVMPLVTAVNISDSLLVRARNNTFVFPISSVVASLSVDVKDVTTTTGRARSIMYLGSILPLFDLMAVFGEAPIEVQDDLLRVIIIEHKKERLAYCVSDFLSPQKIVISEFDEGLKVKGLLGTATLSGRQLGMVIDLQELFALTLGYEVEADTRGGVGRLRGGAPASVPATGPKREVSLPSPSASAGEPAHASLERPLEGEEEAGEGALPDSVFLQELESMLGRLNRELLALDEKRDTETADSVFRLMHSIKGNLTMYGAERPAGITHKAESLLERARRRALELRDEVFDVLFDAASYLEEVVAAFQKQEPAPEPSRRLLEGLAAYQEAPKRPDEFEEEQDLNRVQVKLDPTGEFHLSSRRRAGDLLFQCRIHFEPGDQPRFLVAYLILRRLQNVADVLGAYPSLADLEAGLCEDGLVALIAVGPQNLGVIERLEQNLKRYFGVTHFEAQAFA
ncbi:MAG TPA: ATP-binding protein [Candidatus Sumerlaeota bacterium]|nr:ATP-binding protein [Candidatus Sumerlaeota bacterium]